MLGQSNLQTGNVLTENNETNIHTRFKCVHVNREVMAIDKTENVTIPALDMSAYREAVQQKKNIIIRRGVPGCPS